MDQRPNFAGDNALLRMNLSADNGANLITSGVTGAAYHQLMNAASSGHDVTGLR